MPIIPTEADLDASVEMLAFMWVSIGGDPASVTTLTLVRTLLAQNFAQLPPELQTLFADGRANNRTIQREWHAAEPMARLAMAQQFQQLLAVLGIAPEAGVEQPGYAESGGQSLNADIASNIAWNSSGAGDWSSR